MEEVDVGDALMLTRVLHTQTDSNEKQRGNRFETRCTIKGKVCSIIIDSGSCTNVAFTVLVERLKLPTLNHNQPYKLQWLSNGSTVQVTEHCL